MPTVPTYDTPQVAPSAIPGASVQGLSPRQLDQGQENDRNLQRAGQSLLNLGSETSAAMNREQMLANQVRVDDALNKVRAAQQQLTYDPTQGYISKTGPAAIEPNAEGQGLTDVYGSKLQSTIDEASSGLANPAQQRVFQEQAANLRTQFDGQLQNHVLKEYTQFGLQTQQGTVDLAQNAAVNQWNDPEAINQQLDSAKAAVWKAGQLTGEPANLTEAKMMQTASKIHLGVIDAALQNNNPEYAVAYINKYKDDMTATDALKAQGVVRQDMTARVATGTAMTAMAQHRAGFQPTDMDRVLQITAQTESNNNPNAEGPMVKGQGTAKGSMQVMDATNTDPGFGVTPAADNSQAERVRVGKEYMAAMVQKYGGNTAQAWAAYNAGPGNVDKAIKDAGPTGDWLGALANYQSPENHTQTVNYVQKNQAAYANGAGAPPMPSIQDIHDNIREKLGPNADPKILQASLAEGTRMYADALNDRKVQGENITTQAQQWLIQNGGNFAAMPAQLKSALVSDAPDKWDNLQNFAKNIATPPIKSNMAAYHTAMQNPEELAKMPDSVFTDFAMTNFAPTEQKQIAKIRQDELSGKADASAGALHTQAVTAALNNRLLSIGIDPKPKASDEKAKEQIGTVQKFITDGIYANQQQLGRKMTGQEISDYIDTQFAKNNTFKTTFLGIPTGTTTAPYLGMKLNDIPSEDVAAVKASLAKNGNSAPSNDQVLRTYWTWKQNNGQ
jgi:soluble lytic murein transglycosylase